MMRMGYGVGFKERLSEMGLYCILWTHAAAIGFIFN